MSAARSWLQRCRSTCTECSQVDGNLSYPGRLVDVDHASETLDIALVDSYGSRLGDYVALSYCWGPVPQPQKTMKANRDGRKKGFASSVLPRSLIDAIFVTRALGIRYIWIDSLCIMQDDPVDKKTEIRKMKSVYEGATLTIIAASAELSTDGFLHKRSNPSSDPIGDLPFWTPDGEVGRCYIDRTDYDHSRKDPVHTRAWTMEEWILSKRRLIFSQQEILWKCRSFRDHDGGVHQRYAGLPAELELFKNTLKRNPVLSGDDAVNTEDLLEAEWQRDWPEVLSQYTRRTVTDGRDRFIAIDGLVQKLCQSLNLHYVAGLFEEDALLGLCWRCPAQKVREIEASAVEPCPQWSWGKLNYEIWIENNLHRSHPTTDSSVLEIRKLPDGHVELVVEGPVLPISTLLFQLDYEEDTVMVHRDARMTLQAPEHARKAGGDILCHMFPDSRDVYASHGDRMVVLPLRYSPHHIDGLVLLQDAYENKIQFKRVAYLHMFDPTEDDAWIPERLFNSAATLFDLLNSTVKQRISLV